MKQLKRTHYGSGVPVFQIDDAMKTVQSGFTLDDSNLTQGSYVPRGTVISFDEATGSAKVLKSATLVEALGATGKAAKVAKGHLFNVNDFVSANGVSTKINSINTSDPSFDVLNVVADLGVTPEGAALVAGKAEANENAEVPTDVELAVPITKDTAGLLYLEIKVGEDLDVTVLSRGTVYARRIPAVTDAVKATLSNIFFSQSH